MPTLAQQLAADLAAGIADHGQTVIWNGATYACVRKTAPAGMEYQGGGYVDRKTETILIARALFIGTLPAKGDSIDSGALQVKEIDPATAHLLLLVGTFDE